MWTGLAGGKDTQPASIGIDDDRLQILVGILQEIQQSASVFQA
jgi:hypothetical protein